MNRVVTAAVVSFFAFGSSLALAQAPGPMMGKDTSKTGATPPNRACSSAPLTSRGAKESDSLNPIDVRNDRKQAGARLGGRYVNYPAVQRSRPPDNSFISSA